MFWEKLARYAQYVCVEDSPMWNKGIGYHLVRACSKKAPRKAAHTSFFLCRWEKRVTPYPKHPMVFKRERSAWPY